MIENTIRIVFSCRYLAICRKPTANIPRLVAFAKPTNFVSFPKIKFFREERSTTQKKQQ